MNGSDALTAVAEIALGLAGFTGIVVALSGRSDSWTPLDVVRSAHLLMLGFVAMMLSLLPFALEFFGLPEPTIWRFSSGAQLLCTIPFFVVQRRLGSELEWNQNSLEGLYLPISFFGAAVLAVQVANLWFAQLSLFFVGLLWYLVLGGLQFAAILFDRPRA